MSEQVNLQPRCPVAFGLGPLTLKCDKTRGHPGFHEAGVNGRRIEGNGILTTYGTVQW